MRFLGIFLSLVCRINLILHNLIEMNVRKHLVHMLNHSKTIRMHFWMIQRAKNELFGHFLEFGLSDPFDIAYCDNTKSISTFGNLASSWRVIQKSQNKIFEHPKERKSSFLSIFSTLVCWIHLILLIAIVQYVCQHLAMLPGHEGSFKCHCENEILVLSFSFAYLIESSQSSNKVHLLTLSPSISKEFEAFDKFWSWDKRDSALQFSTSVEVEPTAQ